MKVPGTAVVEFRCDCGNLIGYVDDGALTARRRFTGRSRAEWQRWTLPASDQDLRENGFITSCGEHSRLIVGGDWDILPGRKRRKVIVSRHPEDGST